MRLTVPTARASVSAERTIPATVSIPVARKFGILSMHHHTDGPALRHHGPINDDGIRLVTFDRRRITLDLVVDALRQEFGEIEYAVETMPAVTQ